MSAPAYPAQTAPRPSPRPIGGEVAASSRYALLYLFGAAVFWLVINLCFALIDSLKFHAPGFLADIPYLTYGRVLVAQQTSFLYGFAAQGALGVGIWLFSRLGRTPVVGQGVAILGAVFWNFAVTVSIIGNLCGDATAYAGFGIPSYACVILLVGYLLIGICALLTFNARTVNELYPSQMFALGSMLWFPWIFSTAIAMLVCMPARGVLQSITSWWYLGNFNVIFLDFAGLASVLYFIPKLIGRPLYSSYLGQLSLWTFVIFGSLGGIPNGAPVPSWIVSVSIVATVLTAVPVLAISYNFYKTTQGSLPVMDSLVPLRFAYIAVMFWFIASFQRIVGVLPSVGSLVDYTWYGVAQSHLIHYGFFALALFGAIYYILPQLLDPVNVPVWAQGLVKLHLWCSLMGIIISFLSLLVGGIAQGFLLADPRYSFNEVTAGTLMGLRLDTLGILLLLVGTIFFLLNISLMISGHCWRYCAATLPELIKERHE